jgi:hypothetical protein
VLEWIAWVQRRHPQASQAHRARRQEAGGQAGEPAGRFMHHVCGLDHGVGHLASIRASANQRLDPA